MTGRSNSRNSRSCPQTGEGQPSCCDTVPAPCFPTEHLCLVPHGGADEGQTLRHSGIGIKQMGLGGMPSRGVRLGCCGSAPPRTGPSHCQMAAGLLHGCYGHPAVMGKGKGLCASNSSFEGGK